jgi:hypothetical protein
MDAAPGEDLAVKHGKPPAEGATAADEDPHGITEAAEGTEDDVAGYQAALEVDRADRSKARGHGADDDDAEAAAEASSFLADGARDSDFDFDGDSKAAAADDYSGAEESFLGTARKETSAKAISAAEAYRRRAHERRTKLLAQQRKYNSELDSARSAWTRYRREQLAEYKRHEGKGVAFDRRARNVADAITRKLFRKYINFFQRYYVKGSPYVPVAQAVNPDMDRGHTAVNFRERYPWFRELSKNEAKKALTHNVLTFMAGGDPDV